MKIRSIHIILLLLCIGCRDDPQVGTVVITVDNVRLFNQESFFVESGVYLDDDDTEPLVSFPMGDISLGAAVRYEATELLPGNYYYIYITNIGNRTGARPFQVIAGSTTEITIEL